MSDTPPAISKDEVALRLLGIVLSQDNNFLSGKPDKKAAILELFKECKTAAKMS